VSGAGPPKELKTIMKQVPGWWIEQIERCARELGYPDGPRGLPRHQVFHGGGRLGSNSAMVATVSRSSVFPGVTRNM
jgi:hypothetical protein